MQSSRRKLLQFMGVGASTAAITPVVASVVDKPIVNTPVGPFPSPIIKIGEDWSDYGKYLKRRLEIEFNLLRIERHDSGVFFYTVRDRSTDVELSAQSKDRYIDDTEDSGPSADMARTRYFRSVDRAINELKQQFVTIDIGIAPVSYSQSHYTTNS